MRILCHLMLMLMLMLVAVVVMGMPFGTPKSGCRIQRSIEGIDVKVHECCSLYFSKEKLHHGAVVARRFGQALDNSEQSAQPFLGRRTSQADSGFREFLGQAE